MTQDEQSAQEPLAYTIPETARLLHTSPSTVKRMLAAGTLKAIYVGSHRRVPRAELYRLLETPDNAAQEAL